MISENGKVYFVSWQFLRVVLGLQYNLLEDTDAFNSTRWPSTWHTEFNEVSFWVSESQGLVVQHENIDENQLEELDSCLAVMETQIHEFIYHGLVTISDSFGEQLQSISVDEVLYFAYSGTLLRILHEFLGFINKSDLSLSYYVGDFEEVKPIINRLISRLETQESNAPEHISAKLGQVSSAYAAEWLDTLKRSMIEC